MQEECNDLLVTMCGGRLLPYLRECSNATEEENSEDE